jgi:hypothetical protein
MSTLTAAATLVLALVAPAALAAEPVVAVVYRGSPSGAPSLDDLGSIKAAGFGAVTWRSNDSTRVEQLRQLADTVGLRVLLEDGGSATQLTVDTRRVSSSRIPAIVWRALAHGVRTISFDPGLVRGAGLDAPDGQWYPWVAPAVALARQVSANARLFADLRFVAEPQYISLRPAALEVRLLETAQAWVVVATNVGTARTSAEVALPQGVPYAIWVSLIDATTVGMIDRPTGPRWRFALEAGAASAYVIDKSPRQ